MVSNIELAGMQLTDDLEMIDILEEVETRKSFSQEDVEKMAILAY